jgi:hypothetical protein
MAGASARACARQRVANASLASQEIDGRAVSEATPAQGGAVVRYG